MTESFLPTLNGVTTSVLAVLEHLRLRGHRAVVIAPDTPGLAAWRSRSEQERHLGFDVHRIPAVAYRQFPVALPHPVLDTILAASGADVLHAASPFLLGGRAITAAGRLGIPLRRRLPDRRGRVRTTERPVRSGPAGPPGPRAHPRGSVADAGAVLGDGRDARGSGRPTGGPLGSWCGHGPLPPGPSLLRPRPGPAPADRPERGDRRRLRGSAGTGEGGRTARGARRHAGHPGRGRRRGVPPGHCSSGACVTWT
ncbi:glycosyltransferase [Curtobacterium sp. MCPF17_052]|uniref:glycosyltransferase n=1 Tax=Curtobacterium sp. MCPF17_052 TaxID=2175655 RepID=UPI0024DFB903|nr:glycosyltransferase [Curtobacterium sp. MCPF17_052]WIB13053.1 glycosyltransferase [Curtobacterium sp. MCPF17_052]